MVQRLNIPFGGSQNSLMCIMHHHTFPPGAVQPLEEIGKMYNVTRERIRQIEAKALRKLRHPTRVRHLQGFLETDEEAAA